jgi:ABC-type branched-subunit amino acid transport system ATPase component
LAKIVVKNIMEIISQIWRLNMVMLVEQNAKWSRGTYRGYYLCAGKLKELEEMKAAKRS